jgi:hypothetical protein
MSRIFVNNLPLLFLVTIFSSACAPTILVGYSVDGVTDLRAQRYMDVVINVNQFRDARLKLEKNKLSFRKTRLVSEGERDLCVNSEYSYSGAVVPLQISKQIGIHLRKRNNYKAITVGKYPQADFYLSGSLAAFHGRQDQSFQSAVGMGIGGVLGAVIAAGARSPTEIIIAFDNLKLLDQSGAVVAELPPIFGSYKKELPSDDSCWRIFDNVNAKLKLVIARLADELDRAVWRALGKPTT